ncbi:TolC family protein [Lutispora sp.]|uniref:TolC family protein n=1 Tax=Lutispora sp. TaxID=2828727 RepID=UPI003569378B
MKKLCRGLALILCTAMLLSSITVLGDTGTKTILTLQEAKELALKNNKQYKVQDSYINQKKEAYVNLSARYSGGAKGSNTAEKAGNRITSILDLDRAFNAVELEKFKKNDIKWQSDYDVTQAYYGVMKAKYELDDAKRNMELVNKNLEIAKIKLEFGMITKTDLSKVENEYKTAQTNYSTKLSSLKNAMTTLSKEIGKELDINIDDIDMSISIPNTAPIDLEKIKQDNLNNNTSFFNLKQELELAKTRKSMTQQEYDDYLDKNRSKNDNVSQKFDDMIYDANRDYDNTLYQYDKSMKELDISLQAQLAAITTMTDTIANLRKSLENQKTTFAQSKIRYENGDISKIEYEISESALKDMENMLMATIVELNSQYLSLTRYSYTN